ncbi:PRELI domain-containing protein 1, mitochondrial [Heterocephalus glaber]|uniref:PRELI domain-containing protein 1, mitochondrial n=1 Tax=Heterocephalus glaber TaxID=10181 RepID=G5BD40_HETGA|nr:PRELI domain-containing protein 1, mitochondrial [Heterocephalus glaber]
MHRISLHPSSNPLDTPPHPAPLASSLYSHLVPHYKDAEDTGPPDHCTGAVQEFGLAGFKSNVTKTMKGFEYILAKLQGEAPYNTLIETAKEVKEKAKESMLATTEKTKDLASKAATKQQQQQQQFV